MNTENMSNIKAIKTFFEAGSGRPVTMQEMKELTTQDRVDLGQLCRKALSEESA